ncbi:MAG: 4a-hydroxytetrahydrobiopterin dehydratase [Deltaproteobacteria bacterium]|nr:4a-hydroxytetrahydrobiopterin dehydratase [Deltaproteobacteria bacterium]
MSDSLEDRAERTISRDGLTPNELEHELAMLGARWKIDGKALRLDLSGPMARNGLVAAHAAALADELDHHPRIVLERTAMSLTIQNTGEVSVLDLVYAARVEQWLRANGWPQAT